MTARIRLFPVLFFALFLFSNSAFSSPLLRIVPAGTDIPTNRKIRLEFDRPMVPLGTAEVKALPLQLTPEVTGSWRWTDPQTLSFHPDPDTGFAPATRYTLVVKNGLQALDGTTIAPTEHGFVTTRPAPEGIYFRRWQDPVTPVFAVRTNLPVTRASAKAHYRFLHGKDVFHVTVASATAAKRGATAAKRWEIRPTSPLPADADIRLAVSPGLRTPEGSIPGPGNPELKKFATLPPFRFLGVRYRPHEGPATMAGPAEKPVRPVAANPHGYTELVFSAPVSIDAVEDAIAISPLPEGNTALWQDVYRYDPTRSLHRKGRTYSISLPEHLTPDTNYKVTADPSMTDAFGRSLKTGSAFSFRTDHLKPDFTLSHQTAVLETGVPSDLPLQVTNMETLKITGTMMDKDGIHSVDTGEVSLSLPRDQPRIHPLGIRKILPGSGIFTGDLSMTPDLDKWEGAGRFLAIVSPWQMVVKVGHFNTMVWVTDLATGKPVPHVTVQIRKGFKSDLNQPMEPVAEAITGEDGTAQLPGAIAMDPKGDIAGKDWFGKTDAQWLLTAETDQDLVMLPLDWQFSVDLWQVASGSTPHSAKPALGHLRTWGTTAQGIYRTGESIDWKIYVRNQNLTGLIPPPLTGWTLKVTDPRDRTIHTQKDIRLSRFGTVSGSLPIPENGAIGRYQFQLTHQDLPDESFLPMTVLVTDFSTSPFRVAAEIAAKKATPGSRIPIQTTATLHAGGPYAAAPVRIRSRIRTMPFVPASPALRSFRFDTFPHDRPDHDITLSDMERTLDEKGHQTFQLKLPRTDMVWGQLSVEAVVSDDRGKSVAVSTRIPFEGRDRLVGLAAENWVYKAGKPARFRFVVADTDGNPVSGVPVHFTIQRLVTKVVRARSAGNAYTPRYAHTWKTKAQSHLVSGPSPDLTTFSPDAPGRWRVEATITDMAGRHHKTVLPVWVTGAGNVVWETPENNRLEMIPESSAVRVGDTARILIKNPFPGATALITVERYGILRHWVKPLENSAEVLEIPILPSDLPGCYVSVSLLSPRTAAVVPAGNGPDLGKPVLRMGYLPLTVTAKDRTIPVQVKTDRESYKPGDPVHLSLSVPKARAGETELAVAVLDSAVFDLLTAGKDHFDPYQGLYKLDPLDVSNYTLLTRLVGLQRFAAKGATPPGDGGGFQFRENFRSVGYWNSVVIPDADGKAEVTFSAPDNLTGWEVFVMAVTPGDRMGTGHGLFKVNRPTEIRPVMPNFLRKGDTVAAGFTIMNRTDQNRTLTVTVEARQEEAILNTWKQETPTAPWERKSLFFPIRTTASGPITFRITAGDGLDTDALVHTLPVNSLIRMETVAMAGDTTKEETRIAVKIPETAAEDTGEIAIRLSPSRIPAVEGALRYLRDYPYSCWEQRLSRAMGAGLYLSLMDFFPEEFRWDGAEILPEEVLKAASGFQAENGGMAFFVAENDYTNPYLSAFTALVFARLGELGFHPDPRVETQLFRYLDNLLRHDLSKDKQHLATARITALLAMAHRQTTRPDLFARLRPMPERDGIFTTALYLEAAARSNRSYLEVADLVDKLLQHTHRTATGMAVTEVEAARNPWQIGSDIRTQAAVLSAFVHMMEMPDAPPEIRTYPPLLLRQLLLARNLEGRWQGTQENLFASMATAEYALAFEDTMPDMEITVEDGAGLTGTTRIHDMQGAARRFARPLVPEDPGTRRNLTILRKGEGRLYYTASVQFAAAKKAPAVDAGVHIRLRILAVNGTPVEPGTKPVLKRGDRVQMACDVTSPDPRHFLVVEVPLPAGLEPVNRDLANAIAKEKTPLQDDNRPVSGSPWPFYHKEIQHSVIRYYSETVPAGTWRLSFTAQAIAAGTFHMPAPYTEAMYRPAVWGRGEVRQITIAE